jgi:hypothetical protein
MTEHKPASVDRLAIGTRVMLAVGRFSDSPSNPRIGGEFECVGTVIHVGKGYARVTWDNLRTNTYGNYDLIIKSNGEGSYVDIWGDFC